MSFQTFAMISRTSVAAAVVTMLGTCWLATVVAHSNSGPMAEPTTGFAKWQDEEAELPRFIVRIVDQSGQPVPGATVKSKRDGEEVKILIADEAGTLVVKRDFEVNCVLIAKKLDQDQQTVEIGFLHLSGNRVGGKGEQEQKLELKPAGKFRFKVKDDSGNVVEDAKVFGRQLNSAFDFAVNSTDHDGVAELDLPLKTKLEAWVWSPRGVALKRFESENLTSNREINVDLGPVRKTQLVVLDQDDQPAPGVNVSLNFQTTDGSYFNGTYQQTNEFGIINVGWVPKDPKIFFKPFAFTKDQYQMDQRRTMGASNDNPGQVVLYVNKLAKRVRVIGKVQGAIEGARLEVIAKNFQSFAPSIKRFHDFKSTETENGEFELSLVPGISYSISATNDQWASSYGPFDIKEKSDEPQVVELELRPTAPVMVSLTTGSDSVPLTGANVSYRKTQTEFPNRPDGTYFQTVILRSKQSDENGNASFGAAFGDGEITVSHAGWSESRKIIVREGKPTQVKFNAPLLGPRIIKGQVEVPGNARNKFRCEVRVINVAGPGDQTTKTDKEGNWSMEIDWSNASLIAYTADRKYGGIAFAKKLETDAPRIMLRPTVKISGRLIDDVGKPVPNVTLVQYHETQPLIGDESSRLAYHHVQTQGDGSFEFDGVITGITQKLAVQTSPGGHRFVGGDTSYRAGQDYENVMAVFRDSERAARRKAMEAIEELQDEKEQVEDERDELSKQKTPQ